MSSNLIHSDFIILRDLIYEHCKFKISELMMEKESSEYGACTFKLNSTKVIFRIAKITPAKTGQFVTLWKRQGNGPIQPYDIKDEIDIFIVSVRKGYHFGQFIFSQSVLYKHGVISNNGTGGKRAIRVYPPWDMGLNKQAKKTQAWQLEYFLDVANNKEKIDHNRIKTLFTLLSK
ncbi:MepB family protein [Rickettsia endosymbiont of Halotydeus destructor]|uniref:MepB family protein n=1 Tax=Rickettsia endosymbiont of Halotydeus destructor TaxID=2996754 RepID=UPI003BB19719